MVPIIRQPTVSELPTLSDMCMRSKAVLGYDDAFLEACREELTLRADELKTTHIGVAEVGGTLVGVAQVKMAGREADLLKLFVEPETLRSGIGRCLFEWAVNTARQMGAEWLTIEAEPDAVPFYRRMGASDIGLVPSQSIPGRMLPKLALSLTLSI